MKKHPYSRALEQYKSIELQTRIEGASPHELIHLLFQGARSHIAIAQGNIERNQISEKGKHIGKVISIIGGLRSSLDHKNGGEIATNLEQLYDYLQRILLKANLDSNIELLVEANTLITGLHQAWQDIKLEID